MDVGFEACDMLPEVFADHQWLMLLIGLSVSVGRLRPASRGRLPVSDASPHQGSVPQTLCRKCTFLVVCSRALDFWSTLTQEGHGLPILKRMLQVSFLAPGCPTQVPLAFCRIIINPLDRKGFCTKLGNRPLMAAVRPLMLWRLQSLRISPSDATDHFEYNSGNISPAQVAVRTRPAKASKMTDSEDNS